VSTHPTKLKRVATGEPVEAELHDELPLDAFFEAEELWAPERVRILRECVKAKVSDADVPESTHWNWSQKTLKLRSLLSGPLSPYRLFGMKAEGRWQGLMVCCCVGHHSKLHTEPRDVVYVDLVEAAPWNWEVKALGRSPQLRGIGTQLIELAVRWSDDLGFKGRVGLHSLRQSESFYSTRCGMTDLGPDNSYKPPMRYFELSEKAARVFLENQP
jgi:hypothetical protein